MNIFHKVTIQTLLKNKTRTTVTIIGIILSTSMICAVTTFVQSFQNYLYQDALYNQGDWYGMTYSVSGEKIQELEQDKRTDKISGLETIGYAKIDSQNEDKPYLFIGGMDENFEKSMPIHITEGRLPENNGEILLPDHLASNGGVKYAVGDTLILDIGERKLQGSLLDQGTFFQNESQNTEENENFKVSGTHTYTVVGFYERPDFEDYSAPGYTALTISGEKKEGQIFTIYYKTKKSKDIYQYMKDYSLGVNTNWEVLAYKGISRYSSFGIFLYGLSAIVIGLIMLGAISLIYNAFSISVSERTKQFGLLASIGATKKQLKHMVLFESLFVSVIGIPIGILCGIGGIGITIYILSAKMKNFIDSAVSMRVSIAWWSVLAAIAIALVTVLLSAWIPSKRATKISPVDAIRMSADIKLKAKEVRTGKLIYRFFGLEGMIARKHFKRSRKRYRATVVSLFLSIVLFISASSFCSYLTDSVEGGFSSSSYDISYNYMNTGSESEMKEVFNQLNNVEGVQSGCYVEDNGEECMIASEDLSEEASSQEQYVNFLFIEDEVYKQMLKDNNLDEAAFTNLENPIPVIYDQVRSFSQEEEKYVTYHILKNPEAELSVEEEKTSDSDNDGAVSLEKINLNGAQRIKKLPENVEINQCVINLLYPYSAFRTILEEKYVIENVAFYFTVKDHALTFEKMKTVLTSMGMNGNFHDYAAQKERDRNLIFVINVFAYGFIVLISLIAAANVFHTISTNIALRRREFAMLKSVGMTPKGFNKMMNYECLLYGTRSLLFGLPVSAGVTYLIYSVVNQGYEIGFYIPWKSVVIAVASVFFVVFATMIYAMSKIKKDNPIEGLKSENL